MSSPGNAGSNYCADITGKVGPICGNPYNTCPFVGMGFDFISAGSGPKVNYDIQTPGFIGCKFYIKAASTATGCRFKLPTYETSPTSVGGSCTGASGQCSDDWGINFTGLTPAWTQKTVALDQVVNGGDLSQEGWGMATPFDRTKVYSAQWQFNNSQPGQNYDLAIDDMVFY